METQAYIDAMAEARAIASGAALAPRVDHIQALFSALDSLTESVQELQKAVEHIARWTWDEQDEAAGIAIAESTVSAVWRES